MKVPPPTTLSDVLIELAKIDTINPTKIKAIVAAVSTCRHLLNRPLDALPASPKLLLPMLLDLSPQRANRSPKTLANTRTLVKKALILTGAGRRVRHDGTPLSPAWQALYDRLPTKRVKYALSRLIHYANQAGISPDQVNESFLEQFVADIAKSGEVKNVPLRHRDSAVFWNQCATSIKGWPQTFLHEPVVKRVMRNLPWDHLPENLRQEIDVYCAWLSGTDVFAEDGPAKPCKPSTIRQRREMLRIAASNLIAGGVASEAVTLDALIDPENAKIILRRMHAHAGDKTSAFIRAVATELVYIASRYRPNDQTRSEKLKDLRRRLGSLPSGLTKKNRTMLQNLEDTRLLDKLLGVPAMLAHQARNGLSVVRRVQKMQIAVAIELLLCAPIRLGNLSTLELGRQLPKTFSQRDRIHLTLSAHEVKNGRPMLLPIAASARTLLDEYVRDFRPLIAKPEECSLFVGNDGHAKSSGSLRDGIVKAIKRYVGIHVTPHQFRHLAGELILRENPGAYGLVQQVLGHINLKTTMNFYAADHSRDAGRVLDGIVTARRQRTKV